MDVLGIGLANIDLVAHVTDDFLAQHKLTKGQAQKLGDLAFGRLRADLSSFQATAGGCAANTMCGLSAAGFKTRFFGKIGADSFESMYRSAFREYGVEYTVTPSDLESSQCAVLVTPDGQRSFAYTQGASWKLGRADFDFENIETPKLVYTEIYAMEFGKTGRLWPFLVNHFRNSKVGLAVKVVDREYAQLYSSALFALAEEGILTLITGNSDNLRALTGKDSLEDAIEAFKKWSCSILLTDGENGAHYIYKDSHILQTPIPINAPSNTSGAGDQFVAGYIEGILQDLSVSDRLELAERRAKDILMQDAPRPIAGKLENMAF